MIYDVHDTVVIDTFKGMYNMFPFLIDINNYHQ